MRLGVGEHGGGAELSGLREAGGGFGDGSLQISGQQSMHRISSEC